MTNPPLPYLGRPDRLVRVLFFRRLRARPPHASTLDEFLSYLPPPVERTMRDAEKLRAAAEMFREGAEFYRCPGPGCDRLTPVYLGAGSAAFRVHTDGAWTRYARLRPWEDISGTACLFCRRTVWRGWLTGRRYVRRDAMALPALAEAAT